MRTRAAQRERGKWVLGRKLVIDLRGAMPVPKGSMRAFNIPGRKVPIITDSKTTELRAFERDVREVAAREMHREALPCAQEQPFEILLVYFLPRAKSDFDAHGGIRGAARTTPWVKPDLDKLERATLDALTGMVWDDDSRVVRCVKEKRFSSAERDIGLWIEIRVQPATMRELAEYQQLKISGAA